MVSKYKQQVQFYFKYLKKRLEVNRFRRKLQPHRSNDTTNLKQHLCCFRPQLNEESGHYLNNSLGLLYLAERKGWDISFFSKKKTSPSVLELLPAKPVLPAGLLKKNIPPKWKAYYWEYYLHKYVTPTIQSGDWLYFAEARFDIATAAIAWIQSLPVNRRPFVILEFLSYCLNWFTTFPTFINEKKLFITKCGQMEELAKQSIICCNEVEYWSDKLSSQFGLPVLCLPTTKFYDDFPPLAHRQMTSFYPGKSLNVGLLGAMRWMKGVDLLKDMFSKCTSDHNITFFLQIEHDLEDPLYCFFLNQPAVRILSPRLSREKYVNTITNMDVMLLPYTPKEYAHNSSGIFCEAVVAGIPVVVSENTWMAEIIEKNKASGVVFSPYSANAAIRALDRCIGNLDVYRSRASLLAGDWRRNWSAENFFDNIIEEIRMRNTLSV